MRAGAGAVNQVHGDRVDRPVSGQRFVARGEVNGGDLVARSVGPTVEGVAGSHWGAQDHCAVTGVNGVAVRAGAGAVNQVHGDRVRDVLTPASSRLNLRLLAKSKIIEVV